MNRGVIEVRRNGVAARLELPEIAEGNADDLESVQIFLEGQAEGAGLPEEVMRGLVVLEEVILLGRAKAHADKLRDGGVYQSEEGFGAGEWAYQEVIRRRRAARMLERYHRKKKGREREKR